MNNLGIRRVKAGGTDIDGILRGKYVSRAKFDSMAADGFGFCDVIFGWDANDVLYDNALYTGWHTGYPDAQARLDLDTFRVIPWEPDTAFFLADFEDGKGGPLGVSPRQVLKRTVARANALGYHPTFAAEYEFFFFKETSQTASDKRYQDMTPFSPGMFGYSVLRTGANAEFVHEVMDALDRFNVEVEGFHTETGPGVYEAAIRYDDALASADKAVLFKSAVKQIANRHGYLATFMAKWNDSLPGCGGHIHQSLQDVDGNGLFFKADAPYKMSDLMRQYVAGQVALMPELTALVCPTINSYKRLVPGTWAPTTSTWGVENRTTALRVIPGSAKSTRVEYRLAGADANPYLAMAAALASGLHGIENNLTLGEPLKGSGYDAASAAPLPSTLEEATRRLRESKIARELLGDEFVEHFCRTREWEVRQFKSAVTDWERERYLEVI
ncbi:MAG: glutamine synthetase [Armatimonadetes bacterium]|nr:glutamine synthetase [Armatimonadota bacterium]